MTRRSLQTVKTLARKCYVPRIVMINTGTATNGGVTNRIFREGLSRCTEGACDFLTRFLLAIGESPLYNTSSNDGNHDGTHVPRKR